MPPPIRYQPTDLSRRRLVHGARILPPLIKEPLEISEIVRPLFLAAGWFPSRRVAVPATVPLGHPAYGILAEFGGLQVEPVQSKGEQCGTADVAFGDFEVDEEFIASWPPLLGTALIGFAEVSRGHGALYLAEDGRVFGSSLVHDAAWFSAASFGEAMERCLLGRRDRPLLRPGQTSVCLYGQEFDLESPDLYTWQVRVRP